MKKKTKKIKKTCPTCKNIFFVTPCASTQKYCSRKCYNRNGPMNPKWRGGKMLVDGYVYVYSPDHPSKTKMGYVCEHRLVMEKKLKRYLNPGEVVHHRDGDKTNNVINNLELVSSTGKHFIEHHLKSRDEKGKFLETK